MYWPLATFPFRYIVRKMCKRHVAEWKVSHHLCSPFSNCGRHMVVCEMMTKWECKLFWFESIQTVQMWWDNYAIHWKSGSTFIDPIYRIYIHNLIFISMKCEFQRDFICVSCLLEQHCVWKAFDKFIGHLSCVSFDLVPVFLLQPKIRTRNSSTLLF